MNKYLILYNPYSENSRGLDYAKMLQEELKFSSILMDITKVSNLTDLVSNTDYQIILCGGDGTINHFVNNCDYSNTYHSILYYPTGSGNDFYRDVEDTSNEFGLVKLTPFIADLPRVTFSNTSFKFINGVGSGIDGYICNNAEMLKRNSDKKINYTTLAVKALLFEYKPCDCEIVVDGIKYSFNNVWLASVMKGKYYGGGFMISPNQDRYVSTISTIVLNTKSKLKALANFPSIYAGKHIEKENLVHELVGTDVSVRMDRKSPIQIDGEVFPDIQEYNVKTKKLVK